MSVLRLFHTFLYGSIVFCLGTSVLYAQSDAEPGTIAAETHPITSGTVMRFPMEAATPQTAHAEGILGHRFPNIHGGEALHFDYLYTGGVFNNARGGIQTKRATAYVGLMEIGMTADTEKLGLWKNGTFYVHSLFSHGQNPSRYVGDEQALSVFAYDTPAQVSEYWYQHRFADDRFVIKGGKLDAGGDFFYLEATADFINSSGTCVPTTGIPTAPANAWGMTGYWDVNEHLCLKAGFFDADGNADKFWMSESGNIYSAYQAEFHYDLFKHLPGFVYAGAWYNDAENYSHRGHIHQGKGGYSVGFEQMLYRKNYLKEDDLRGLTFFAQFSRPDSGKENDWCKFWAWGLNWQGLFESRPDDKLGFGMFNVCFEPDRRFVEEIPFSSETAYEVHYRAALTDNVVLQPILQYIVHPSGRERNAFVPGIVFQMVF